MDRRTEGPVYRFDPFELDAGRRRLTKDGELVPLPDRQLDVVLVLCAAGGRLVSKNELAESAWHGIAVSDNSIDKAVSSLRQALGLQPDGTPCIESRKRKGVRLVAPVVRVKPSAPPPVSLDALLEPYQAFVDGRTAIETLDREAVGRAFQAFSEALRLDPDLPLAHIGLANVYLLRFESTRADAAPDRAALERAAFHAREACRLDPASGDPWSTLAFVLHRSGAGSDAIAPARRAVSLEPQEWRHHLRLASVSWGSERLRAALRVLSLCPGLALGHWFAATVFVARGAFGPAIEHLRAGCAAQDAQPKEAGRYAAVGLHWLHGLVLAARGDYDGARDEFARELALADPRHVYGRECIANIWYAIGALALRVAQWKEAREAFEEALARVPGHAMAVVGLAAATRGKMEDLEAILDDVISRRASASPVEQATVRAAVLALQGKHDEAARAYEAAFLACPSEPGWLLAVDPLLRVAAHVDAWAPVVAGVANRAS